MKAQIITEPFHMQYSEVEKPRATGDMVLVKVRRAGICATDLAIYTGDCSFVRDGSIRYPIRFGHEWSGVVEAVGENVTKFRLGDRVVSDSGVRCNKCDACLRGDFMDCRNIRSVGTINTWDGCFAEYMLMPEYHLYRLSDNVSLDEGALIEPATISYDAFTNVKISKDSVVAVFGTGAIGMGCAWLARYLGAAKVIMVGRQDAKLEVAQQIGATDVVNNTKVDAVNAIQSLTGGIGADVTIETSGAESALIEAIRSTVRYGRLSILSFYDRPVDHIPVDTVVINCLSIRGAAGHFGYPEKINRIMSEYGTKLTPIISGRFDLENCTDYFDNKQTKYKNYIKAMVELD